MKAKEHRRGLAPLMLRAAGWPRPVGGGLHCRGSGLGDPGGGL